MRCYRDGKNEGCIGPERLGRGEAGGETPTAVDARQLAAALLEAADELNGGASS